MEQERGFLPVLEASEPPGQEEVAFLLEVAASEPPGQEEEAFLLEVAASQQLVLEEEALELPEQAERSQVGGVEEGLLEAVESVLHRPPCAAPCSVEKRLGFNIPRRGTQ